MKKVVYLGTKEIGKVCLEHLISQQNALGFEIVGVLTNQRQLGQVKNGTVSSVAFEAGIAVLSNLDEFLALPVVDIAISVQYHEILKTRHIAKANERFVNLHMAPLPEYRGCNQFSFAIINGDKEFGVTLHEIDEGIDSGPILTERRFPIPDGCFVGDLYSLAYQESILLFKESLHDLVGNQLKAEPQSARNGVKSELHFRNEIHRLKNIDLEWDAETISRHIRATAMPGFPPPFVIIGDRKVEFVLNDE